MAATGGQGKRACLMYQDGEFGANAKTGFKAAGINFAEETSYYSGQQLAGFQSQVTTLARAQCELVVFFGVTSATAVLLGTAAKAGFKPTWMVKFSWATARLQRRGRRCW